MKFKYSKGRTIKGLKIEVVASELQRIYDKESALRASRVVEEAKPKKALLHPAFEWDDTVCGVEYRLEQARRLVRLVQVVDEHDEAKSSPMFFHVAATPTDEADGETKTTREGAYHPASVVVENIDLFQSALMELEQRMRSAMSAVEALRQAAAQTSSDPDRMARVALAVRALETASQAISSLH